MQYGQLDYFVVSETTVDNSFPSAHFMVNDYKVRVRGDRDKYGDLVQFYQKWKTYPRLKSTWDIFSTSDKKRNHPK